MLHATNLAFMEEPQASALLQILSLIFQWITLIAMELNLDSLTATMLKTLHACPMMVSGSAAIQIRTQVM